MAPAPQDDMSSPGTATYDSDRLTVGDGTWDFSKNTFLLPNLMGLPFDTMRYNGEYPPRKIGAGPRPKLTGPDAI